ncbi:MAG: anthranilate phosphoribosyltransferase, partial [Acidobacteria bacterium]|nr:anthranilate phosphoribosyltransferase [Acidobacteriota bacterium]
MTAILRKYTNEFKAGRHLKGPDATELLDAMIAETDESMLADIFRAWDKKGIEADEIHSIAQIMRERAVKVRSKHEQFVDIVGTGGSKIKTFNVSTAAAFVVAGAGLPVAKHGNKAATSNSGSADVLSELGVEPAVDAATAERNLNEIGICFMFAPNFHRLSATLGKVRRGLGFPTIFNCVGPLCNPASAPYQVIGVWEKELVSKMAEALARLGTKKSWIVHGSDGLDEISLSGPTFVAEVVGSKTREFIISPEDFGEKAESIMSFKADSAVESAKIIKSIFGGKHRSDAIQTLVSVN